MAKASSRKHAHATHKKARTHHAVKTHGHRPNGFRPATPGVPSSTTEEVKPESDSIGDESSLQAESRVIDNSDDEAGIYGPDRGETAG